jgi:uncharacterized protein (DUF2236 family)
VAIGLKLAKSAGTPLMFPAESVIRRVNAEPALLFGAGRALLLQLAHPAVAAGVRDHSEFERNPFARLQGTLEAVNAMVFGSVELAEGVGRRVRWIHDFVTGPAYAANDPVNLLWVHATLVDTALRCYESLVEPLTAADAETYYVEMKRVGEMFGLAVEDQPPTLADFRSYFDATVDTMAVTDAGRELSAFIVDPTLPLGLHVPMAPLLRTQRLFAVGTLPPSLREQLGFDWTTSDEVRLQRATRRVRGVFRRTPRAVRTLPTRVNGVQLLWMAQRHVRQFDEKRALSAA